MQPEMVNLRVDVVVDDECDLYTDIHDYQTFCTKLEGQDFDGVSDKQAGPSESVRNAVKPEEGDNSNAGALVPRPRVLRAGNRGRHEE